MISRRPRGRREQLRHVADARERHDRGRNVPVTQRAARVARRDRPFEQHRKACAVNSRDPGQIDLRRLDLAECSVALGEHARRVVEAELA